MPLRGIVCGLKQGTHSVKLNLNNIRVYKNIIFNRTYSSVNFDNVKGWFVHYSKEDAVSYKTIELTFNSYTAETLRYEKDIYSELVEELELDELMGSELKYFFSKDINHFKYFGIELDRGELAEKLVKYLKPFQLDMTPIYYYPKAKRLHISLKTIIALIEAQYLAYRLDIEFKIMWTYFKEMKSCYFHYKSMRSIKRNMDAIMSDKKLRQMNVSNIVFFLNTLRPFSVKHLKEVEKDLVGVNWERTPVVCPTLVKHSYYSIIFRIKMLREMGFTDEQIRFGLPYVGILLPNLYRNISLILSEFDSYKDDEYFLRILGACFCRQRGLYGMVWKSYEAIQKALVLKEEKRESLMKSRQIICFLQERLGMTRKEWKVLRNHPAIIVETRVLDAINLLEEKGFTKEEILESIPIILYPKYLIKKNLERVVKENDNLRKLGFENGCLRRKTTHFTNGTKLKRKTLQLCLYYLEKSIHVSEDIVLDWDKLNEELPNQ